MPPEAILVIVILSKLGINSGVYLLYVDSNPNWWSLLLIPQPYTLPSLVKKIVNRYPHETLVILSKLDINVGVTISLNVTPNPDCPKLFWPQLYTLPSLVRNIEWLLPEAISVILYKLGINVGTKKSSPISPNPNCPLVLSPQLYTLPSLFKNRV